MSLLQNAIHKIQDSFKNLHLEELTKKKPKDLNLGKTYLSDFESVDIGCLPLVNKYKPILRYKLSDKPFIVLHITDVEGGFGYTSSEKKKWTNILKTQDWPEAYLPIKGQIAYRDNADDRDIDVLASQLCIWERYRKTPYHCITTQRGDIVFNADLKLRTAHAGAGNDGFGFAMDCGRNEKPSFKALAACAHALILLQIKIKQLYNIDEILITAHRCFSKDRASDPGQYVWKELMTILPDRYKKIDFTLVRDTGKPIPQSWDNRSPFKG